MVAFVRMSELSPAWVNRDFHMHTRYTDGKAEVATCRDKLQGLLWPS